LASLILATGIALAEPTIEQGEALLGDSEQYGAAIRIFESLLERDPTLRRPRLQLARVLSWQGEIERSLAAYSVLIELDAGDREARLEKAEVLSWSGRYEESEELFLSLLAEDADDARAQRGLARVYNWSGQIALADRAYRRGLALEDHEEARAEWKKLRAAGRPDAGALLRYFEDNAGFHRFDTQSKVSALVGFKTRVSPRLALIRVWDSKSAPLPGEHDGDRAVELSLGAEQKIGETSKLGVRIGGRDWSRSADSLFGSVDLEVPLSDRAVFTGRLEHGDFVDGSSSLQALQAEIQQTRVSAGIWRDLGRGFESYLSASYRAIDDGNASQSVDLSLDYAVPSKPWLGLWTGASFVRYEDRSPNYYDPERDLTLLAGVASSWSSSGTFEINLRLGGGVGSSQTITGTETGTIWTGSTAASWTHGPWSTALRAATSASQRSNAYRGTHLLFEIRRGF
jgi:tetratricopeptide (TPR) repeat protein